jgi:hypothetical protein
MQLEELMAFAVKEFMLVSRSLLDARKILGGNETSSCQLAAM